MKHTARVAMTAAEAIGSIGDMPKERGTDFFAGRMAAGAVVRTYTRVDGNQFQVSRTAGMGISAVVSGKVTDDENGGAVVLLSTTFGIWPLGMLLVAAIFLLASGAYFAYAREFFYAFASVFASGVSIFWYWVNYWDARYLRSKVSDRLGGVDWVLDQQ